MEQEEEILETWGVMQIDSQPGLPLRCESHIGKKWCACRSKLLAEGADGPTLWHRVLISGGPVTEVDVNITMHTIIPVTLYVEDWPPDRGLAQMEVALRGNDISSLSPFKDDPRLTRVGWLNYDEGRAVLRELIMNRFASIFIQLEPCKSKFHGPQENKLYRDSRMYPARAWDWDFEMWRHEGTCPPCLKRARDVLIKAYDANLQESVPKSSDVPVVPWKTKSQGRVGLPSSLSSKYTRPESDYTEEDVPF